MSYATARSRTSNAELNKVLPEDQAVHRWYRFVLSFPPHLVRHYLGRWGVGSAQTVLDPFCGTGTVVVECKKLGIPSVGVEANPMAAYAARTKIDWSPDPSRLREHAERTAGRVMEDLAAQGIGDSPDSVAERRNGARLRSLPAELERLLLAGSISPLPLHKALVLRDGLDDSASQPFVHHERVAFAKALVQTSSNLHFGPEVGVTRPKPDAAVVGPWLQAVRDVADDLAAAQARPGHSWVIHQWDARDLRRVVPPCSIDAVITSPPYPNEKDYTRTTRLESVLLGMIRDKAGLQALKQGLVRSNTRGVYRSDDDDRWVQDHAEIQAIAAAIEQRRIDLGKTSGFERLYARAAKLYFGGMARHLAELRELLRPGARLAYVVGDQASYLQVLIRTGQLLTDLAERLGYEVESIDLFRTRLATATRQQLREEVVVLRWPAARVAARAAGAPQAQISVNAVGLGGSGLPTDLKKQTCGPVAADAVAPVDSAAYTGRPA